MTETRFLTLNCRVDGTHFKVQFGHSVLIRAAGNGHSDCVRQLVEAGANTNAKTDVRDFFMLTGRIALTRFF